MIQGYFRVDFEYLNLEWQEAQFTEVFDDPKDRMSFIISNKQLPCNDEFIFVAKAYGVNGKHLLTTADADLTSCLQVTTLTPPGTRQAV